MRFGAFIPPVHAVDENPTLALQRYLELIELMDRLGFEEAWIGEHHSGGWEIIPSPEVFIAAAIERTKRIRLGTGVSSIPYHHPLMLADRMVLLDHLSRGRVMLGIGPGALSSDALMMGIEPNDQRRMMKEGLEAVTTLLRDDERITRHTDWFTLQDAALQMRPLQEPFPISVAATVSPSGPSAAGEHGCGLVSLGGTAPGLVDLLASHWDVYSSTAAEHGHQVDRSMWTIVGPMHIAETEEQAIEDVRYGIMNWMEYFRFASNLPFSATEFEEAVSQIVDGGYGVIGSPEQAAAQIRRLEEVSGGFGCFLVSHNEWANPAATRRSYELLAQRVIPQFQGTNARPRASWNRMVEKSDQLKARGKAAQTLAVAQYKSDHGKPNGVGSLPPAPRPVTSEP